MRKWQWLAAALVLGLGLGCQEEGIDDPAAAIPPADAVFIGPGISADFVMTEVAGAGNREEAAAMYVGQWVPEPGWNGTVEEITKEKGGTALRMYFYNSRLTGGGFWVVAVVPLSDPGVEKGTAVSVAGRIRSVEVSTDVGTVFRIVLERARVVKK